MPSPARSATAARPPPHGPDRSPCRGAVSPRLPEVAGRPHRPPVATRSPPTMASRRRSSPVPTSALPVTPRATSPGTGTDGPPCRARPALQYRAGPTPRRRSPPIAERNSPIGRDDHRPWPRGAGTRHRLGGGGRARRRPGIGPSPASTGSAHRSRGGGSSVQESHCRAGAGRSSGISGVLGGSPEDHHRTRTQPSHRGRLLSRHHPGSATHVMTSSTSPPGRRTAAGRSSACPGRRRRSAAPISPRHRHSPATELRRDSTERHEQAARPARRTTGEGLLPDDRARQSRLPQCSRTSAATTLPV
ncbi:hypothetical protein UA75_01580 [Actinoalloteichus sp. GBA129-24]|nr:hypothetical protein UA75_01580 [Actinoalloteichus sp. GBA129-24]